jgi:hypothetical protein
VISQLIEYLLLVPVRETLSDELTKHLRLVSTHLCLQFSERLFVVFRDSGGDRFYRYNVVRDDT